LLDQIVKAVTKSVDGAKNFNFD